jgi:hypothetical protein
MADRGIETHAIDWVRLGPFPHLATCHRCGAHEPNPADDPIPLRAFVAYLRAVCEKHRDCREPVDDDHGEFSCEELEGFLG